MRVGFLVDIVLPALMLCWAALLLYSAVAGDTGYRALSALNASIDARAAEVDALRARREALEKRADLLSSKSLDADLVDERVRVVLGFSREGDVVVSRSDLDRLLEADDANSQ